MARKRLQLTPEHEAIFAREVARGSPPARCHAVLEAAGASVSIATIARRVAEARPKANKERAERRKRMMPAKVEDAEKAVEKIIASESSEPSHLATIAAIVSEARESQGAAIDEGDHSAASRWASIAIDGAKTLVRHETPAPEDLNERPDMVALAEKGGAMFFRYVTEAIASARGTR